MAVVERRLIGPAEEALSFLPQKQADRIIGEYGMLYGVADIDGNGRGQFGLTPHEIAAIAEPFAKTAAEAQIPGSETIIASMITSRVRGEYLRKVKAYDALNQPREEPTIKKRRSPLQYLKDLKGLIRR